MKLKVLIQLIFKQRLKIATDVPLFTDKHFTVDPKTHNPLNKMVAIIGVEDSKFTLIENYYPTE